MFFEIDKNVRQKLVEVLFILKNYSNKVTIENNTLKTQKIIAEINLPKILQSEENNEECNEKILYEHAISMHVRDAIDLFKVDAVYIFDIANSLIKYKFTESTIKTHLINFEKEVKFDMYDLLKIDIDVGKPNLIVKVPFIKNISFINKETNITVNGNSIIFTSLGIITTKYTKECIIVENNMIKNIEQKHNYYSINIITDDLKIFDDLSSDIVIAFFNKCIFVSKYYEYYTIACICAKS
ncbi:hypothetical protein EHP00_1413 [Ecytonucleospora hepatopenaei]|uniref:Uncharacterized protein n=1 Tax=Ecytonucleospora hepatopenaei TaxID=646526 RepID=A0A1W0E678_9MICR|nr:hypothetical protein EHP00_1413 [Ecytonucleospora hepatopenaei]